MTLRTRRWLACDHERCTATYDHRRQAARMSASGRSLTLRQAAELEGWAFAEDGHDLCAYHAEQVLGPSDQPSLFGVPDVHHQV